MCPCCLQEYTKQHGLDVPIEVESRTLQEVLEVKELIQEDNNLRIDRVMLDNMTTLDKSHEGDHVAPDQHSVQWLHCPAGMPLQLAGEMFMPQ